MGMGTIERNILQNIFAQQEVMIQFFLLKENKLFDITTTTKFKTLLIWS